MSFVELTKLRHLRSMQHANTAPACCAPSGHGAPPCATQLGALRLAAAARAALGCRVLHSRAHHHASRRAIVLEGS